MVTDPTLVARLRSYPKTMTYQAPDCPVVVYFAGRDVHRAADRIEQLEREVIRLLQLQNAPRKI